MIFVDTYAICSPLPLLPAKCTLILKLRPAKPPNNSLFPRMYSVSFGGLRRVDLLLMVSLQTNGIVHRNLQVQKTQRNLYPIGAEA